MKKCCFLDRDGVVNEEVDYLFEPEKVAIIPGVAEAIKILKDNGFLVIVITNQSGVARGFYEEKDINLVHEKINSILAKDNVQIDDFFYCIHHPKYGEECNCRKPKPGMLLSAAEKWEIDLSQSFMIGDRLSDIYAGRNANCKECFLVKTGYGKEVIAKEDVSNIVVADNILEAVKIFCKG